MPYGNGRNAEFADQAQRMSNHVEQLQERYQRMSANSTYRPRSVLESPSKSGIGLSASDRSRQLLNGAMLPSRNGTSASTYEKRQALGLDSPYRTV